MDLHLINNKENSKVFITAFNSKRILKQFDIENSKLNELITEVEFKWFHQYEVKHLLALKYLYSDINKFLMMYDRIKNQDTLTYFEEGNKPAYHKSFTCHKLNSSFNNFRFTKEMKERKIENEVREWYKEQKKKYNIEIENDRDKIISNCKLRFKLNEIPEFISFDNSSYDKISNYSFLEINDKLNVLINEVNDYYNSSTKVKDILDKFGSQVFLEDNKSVGIEKVPKEYHVEINYFLKKFKSKIAYWLGEYYRVAFNKNIEFKASILEEIGFRECSTCKNEMTQTKNIKSIEDFITEVFQQNKIEHYQINTQIRIKDLKDLGYKIEIKQPFEDVLFKVVKFTKDNEVFIANTEGGFTGSVNDNTLIIVTKDIYNNEYLHLINEGNVNTKEKEVIISKIENLPILEGHEVYLLIDVLLDDYTKEKYIVNKKLNTGLSVGPAICLRQSPTENSMNGYKYGYTFVSIGA